MTSWIWVFVRAGALLAVFPVFSIPNFPVQLRVALAGLMAFMIAPLLPPAVAPATFLGLLAALAKEAGIGLLLGFVSRLVFYLLEFAGNLMAAEMGLNLAASVNPLSAARSEAPALILFYLGAIFFLTLDLHHWLLMAFQKSYTILPATEGRLSSALFADLVGRTSRLFLLGTVMAAPIIAVSFLINLVFSVLGRAVPQMNIFIESLSFRVLAGLVVFGLTLNVTAQHISTYLRRLPEDVLYVAHLLASHPSRPI